MYAALGTDIKYFLNELGGCKCAFAVVSQDMSGFSQREAETLLDSLTYRINSCMDILKDSDKRKFMGLV